MSSYEEFKQNFIQIHRNALVATHYLSSIEKTANGNWVVKMREIDTTLERWPPPYVASA